jgi:hypothetical protein
VSIFDPEVKFYLLELLTALGQAGGITTQLEARLLGTVKLVFLLRGKEGGRDG